MQEAFAEADAWRIAEMARVYRDAVYANRFSPAIWLDYSKIFSSARSCLPLDCDVDTIGMVKLLWKQARAADFIWSNDHSRTFATLYAYHTTGIEGNILTLPQAELVVGGRELIEGCKHDTIGDKINSSILEITNIYHLVDVTGLSSKPFLKDSGTPKIFTVQELVDCKNWIKTNTTYQFVQMLPIVKGTV